MLVWRLDRWGRSVTDLVLTLKELNELGAGFVSLTEALDLTRRRCARWPGYWPSLLNLNVRFCGSASVRVSRWRASRADLRVVPALRHANGSRYENSLLKGCVKPKSLVA